MFSSYLILRQKAHIFVHRYSVHSSLVVYDNMKVFHIDPWSIYYTQERDSKQDKCRESDKNQEMHKHLLSLFFKTIVHLFMFAKV